MYRNPIIGSAKYPITTGWVGGIHKERIVKEVVVTRVNIATLYNGVCYCWSASIVEYALCASACISPYNTVGKNRVTYEVVHSTAVITCSICTKSAVGNTWAAVKIIHSTTGTIWCCIFNKSAVGNTWAAGVIGHSATATYFCFICTKSAVGKDRVTTDVKHSTAVSMCIIFTKSTVGNTWATGRIKHSTTKTITISTFNGKTVEDCCAV